MEPDTFEIKLEALSRLEDVWEAMVAFAGDCGVIRLGYHHLPPPGAPDAGLLRIENDGFAGELLAQYLAARTSGIAVLANIIQNSVRPVYLDELASLVDLTPAERAHLATYRAAGVRNGLGLQVFGPNGRNGIFAVDLGDRPRLAPEVMARLRWAGQAMHLRYCALLSAAARDAAAAFVARGRGADLGGAGQVQRLDRRHPRDLGAHGRCASPADLPQARGRRPDVGGAARARLRADQPRSPDPSLP